MNFESTTPKNERDPAAEKIEADIRSELERFDQEARREYLEAYNELANAAAEYYRKYGDQMREMYATMSDKESDAHFTDVMLEDPVVMRYLVALRKVEKLDEPEPEPGSQDLGSAESADD